MRLIKGWFRLVIVPLLLVALGDVLIGSGGIATVLSALLILVRPTQPLTVGIGYASAILAFLGVVIVTYIKRPH